jgi:predicted metalloenzyme YecM
VYVGNSCRENNPGCQNFHGTTFQNGTTLSQILLNGQKIKQIKLTIPSGLSNTK